MGKKGREETGVRVRGVGKCGVRYVTYKLCTIVCKSDNNTKEHIHACHMTGLWEECAGHMHVT